MKLAITGHRPKKLQNEYDLNGPMTTWIKKEIVKIIEIEEPKEIITGMALGVDTLFALIGIEMAIPIYAAIPCNGQEKRWPYKSQKLYNEILSNSLVTKFVVCAEYTQSCMQMRNEVMTDRCDKIIAVFDGTSGGTANCVKYAEKIGKPILRINPSHYVSE
jgi:uncharacterized phage-like protein YoqJ